MSSTQASGSATTIANKGADRMSASDAVDGSPTTSSLTLATISEESHGRSSDNRTGFGEVGVSGSRGR
jgi:hypothetical protein